MRIRHAPAAALAALLLSAAAVHAQRQAPERVHARGTIVDARTGSPIEGAVIDVARLRRSGRTDARGAFDLGRVPEGTYAATVEAMGYQDAEASLVVAADGEARVALEPDPVLLAAITATADRFESRRRAVGVSSRVMRKREIALSAAPTLAQFIAQTAMLSAAPCGSSGMARMAHGALGGCVRVRGESVAPRVYVDEAPAVGGFEVLESYDPWEIERVEVYGSGRQIRVYTTWFMEHAAKRRYLPEPFVL